jgi:trans-2,3-dihydro-3-hydroxyanthranilate isomerase
VLLETRFYAAFGATPSGGNIAGIVYDDIGLQDEQMRQIAADLSAPTTGFVRQLSDSDFAVRFFSTRAEMEMCGHVTIAVFAALADDGRLTHQTDQYRQLTPAGEIGVEVKSKDGRRLITMRQPRPRFDLIRIEPTELTRPFGLPIEAVVSHGSASTALTHFFLEVSDEAALAALRPDDAALRAISSAYAIDTIGVWCQKREPHASARIRLRDFCHGVGDPEEAASGTTNGALACLLWRAGAIEADAGGRVEIVAEQGFEMGRPSRVNTRLRVRDETVTEVVVGGSAVRRLTGQFEI